MKKIIECLIVALVFLNSFAFADWDGSSRKPKNTREIDGKIFYEISSPEELAWFAEQVNGGKSTINAVLVNDIKFMDDTNKISSVNWTPIGKDSTVIFNGTFDGREYTIYGLSCEQKKVGGLFGFIGSFAVIKNVKSKKFFVKTTALKSYIGSIVAFNEGSISGCTNERSAYTTISDTSWVGGIVGWNEGTVWNCLNGNISYKITEVDSLRTSRFGGIIGGNRGIVSKCMSKDSLSVFSLHKSFDGGGIVGENKILGNVSNCESRSAFVVTYNTIATSICVGGIVGVNDGAVSYCVNDGFIASSNKSFGFDCVGGIVGVNGGEVSNCVNKGNLSFNGTSIGGGLVGQNYRSSWSKAYGWDLREGLLRNSYNVGIASVGVVLHYEENSYIINCFYDSDVLSGYYSGAPNIGKSTIAMQKNEFAWNLNTTNGTDTNSGVWSRDSVGYPIFADSAHKPIYKIIFDDGLISIRYTTFKGLVNFPETLKIPGKYFLGWFDENNNKVFAGTVFTKDQTLSAVYTNSADLMVKTISSPIWGISVADRNIWIHVAPVGKSYALFDLQGKVLTRGRIESSEMTISVPRAGSYIVRVGERSVRVNAR